MSEDRAIARSSGAEIGIKSRRTLPLIAAHARSRKTQMPRASLIGPTTDRSPQRSRRRSEVVEAHVRGSRRLRYALVRTAVKSTPPYILELQVCDAHHREIRHFTLQRLHLPEQLVGRLTNLLRHAASGRCAAARAGRAPPLTARIDGSTYGAFSSRMLSWLL